MSQECSLLQAHAETLYVFDAAGDMRTVDVPWMADQPAAPVFHLGWTEETYFAAFRHDVSDGVRSQVLDLLRGQWPFPVSRKGPPDRADYVQILSGTSRRGSGPAFIVADGPMTAGDAVELTPANAHLLEHGYENSVSAIEVTQPAFAVVVDGRAVSVCRTVRRSVHGIEAGVDTLESYRRRGYARRAVSAWCEAAKREGRLGFYSTSYFNTASCALANSLGLKQFAAEFSAE